MNLIFCCILCFSFDVKLLNFECTCGKKDGSYVVWDYKDKPLPNVKWQERSQAGR